MRFGRLDCISLIWGKKTAVDKRATMPDATKEEKKVGDEEAEGKGTSNPNHTQRENRLASSQYHQVSQATVEEEISFKSNNAGKWISTKTDENVDAERE